MMWKMFKVLKSEWYYPFLPFLNNDYIIGIVKTENNGKIDYHIGSVVFDMDRKKAEQKIITGGAYLRLESLKRLGIEVKE